MAQSLNASFQSRPPLSRSVALAPHSSSPSLPLPPSSLSPPSNVSASSLSLQQLCESLQSQNHLERSRLKKAVCELEELARREREVRERIAGLLSVSAALESKIEVCVCVCVCVFLSVCSCVCVCVCLNI